MNELIEKISFFNNAIKLGLQYPSFTKSYLSRIPDEALNVVDELLDNCKKLLEVARNEK